MATAIVSPEYEIEIPQEIRESMGIRPGDKFEALCTKGHIVLVPVLDVRELRGFAKGIDTTVDRDEEDRI